MELYIDNRRVDTDASTAVSISLSITTITDPQKGRTGYTRSIRIPMTPHNDSVFGYAAEIHGRDRFNASEHTGRIEHEGAVLIEGPLYLSSCERSGGSGSYEVHIIGASKEWARRAASRGLRTTAIDYSKTLTGPNILASWTGDTPVRFLPVMREKTAYDYSSGSVIPAMKVLSCDDYHPFIHAATLLKAIFAESGYTVESDFVDGELFSSLYISGNYPTRDVSVLKANMDFLARRFAPRSAVANSWGRVYADPYRIAFTVGNIVDTADPSQSSGGVSYDDVFTRNGCFQMDDDRIMFMPASAVSVGFQYHIRYTTDYYMKDRNELTGFNFVYLSEASQQTFKLVNNYPDRRTSVRPARTYTLAVFGHVAGRQYQLRYTAETSTGGTTSVSLAAVTTRFSTVAVTTTLPVSNPVLYYRTSSTGTWYAYTGDWALYDGFVTETGTADVELTVRTAPETITPSKPKFFDLIYFGGADPGMTLTVSDKMWVRPVFYAQPSEGSTVSFADVTAHSATQMDFINSMRQMFNLCFHTDNRAKTVRIEPRGDFYSDSRVVDWTGRIDLDKPVTVEELGGDLSRTMAWRYRSGDGAVARHNRSSGETMGYWSAQVENTAAADSVSVWENAMFTCSLNAQNAYLGAPSASLVLAGDASVETLDRTEDLNFEPKVVRYEGMKPLPVNELWGWPSEKAVYPKLAFHAPDEGYTLCFEDRGGCTGLHSRYDRDVRLWNGSRRVTLWLDLNPVDVESLSFPTGTGPDFHTLFRLDLDGEQGWYTLEEVCNYDPSSASTKCIFIKHIP